MESSKATAKHIQQVAGDLPAAQVQLMQHQCTQLPTGNYPRRKQTATRRQKLQNHKTPEILTSQKPSDQQKPDACTMTSALGAVIHYMQRDFNAQLGNSNVRCATNLVTSLLYVIRKVKANSYSTSFQSRKPKAQQIRVGALYTHHDADQSESDSEIEDSFCCTDEDTKNQNSFVQMCLNLYT